MDELIERLTGKLKPDMLGLADVAALEAWVEEAVAEGELKAVSIVDPDRKRAAVEACVRYTYYTEAQDDVASRPESITVDAEGDVSLPDPDKILRWLERKASSWLEKFNGLLVAPPLTATRPAGTVAVPIEVVF
ncbi:MAG: hypothetical protein HC933_04995 [Pleurocapsa sp. SU_196_0]|nr:hypothetical protein [Pleurocapsa sp. SU_196_0]